MLALVSLSVAQMFALATERNLTAKQQVSTTAMATQKMEQLRGLTFSYDASGLGLPVTDTTTNLALCTADATGQGLNPSPSDALEENRAGFVDYLDARGNCVGTGTTPPAGSVFTRRWSIRPLPTNPNNTHHPGRARHAVRERGAARAHREPAHTSGPGCAAADSTNEESAMTSTMTSSSRGYTLVELLVSMGIMVVVTGAIFQLINPSQATAQIQPEVQDMQQRMRVATDTMFKDVVMAGAGPYQGPVTGSLNNFFAPIIPRRIGFLNPDPYQSARTDAITLTYIPNSFSQTTISQAMPISPRRSSR